MAAVSDMASSSSSPSSSPPLTPVPAASSGAAGLGAGRLELVHEFVLAGQWTAPVLPAPRRPLVADEPGHPPSSSWCPSWSSAEPDPGPQLAGCCR